MAIDATKPADGTPADKADIRANWQAVKDVPAVTLAETAAALAGKSQQYPRVKTDETGLEFVAGSATGTDASLSNYTHVGTGASTRTVKAALDERAISVRDFGATGNGSTDDTAAFTAAAAAAFDAAHVNGATGSQAPSGVTARVTGGLLFIPPGQYALKNWTISKTITIMGCSRATRLMPHSTCTTADDIVRVIQPTTAAYRNWEVNFPGLSMQDLMFDGKARTIAINSALSLDFCDQSNFSNIWFEEINGHAIDAKREFRESSIRAIHTKWCGTGTKAVIDLWSETGAGAADGHNEIHISDCFFVFPLGDNIRIGGDTTLSSPTRIIFIHSCMFHGMANTLAYTRESPTRHIYVGSVNHLDVSMCRFHAWGQDPAAAIYLTAESGESLTTGKRAQSITLINNHFSNAFETGVGAVTGQAIFINSGGTQLRELGNQFDSTASPQINDQATSTTVRRWSFTDT